MVGLVLAGAYHYLSLRLQTWSSRQKVTMMPLFAIASFIIRIAVLIGILVVLGLWSGLNIIALCISFIVVFTILNGIWLYMLAVKRKNEKLTADATKEVH